MSIMTSLIKAGAQFQQALEGRPAPDAKAGKQRQSAQPAASAQETQNPNDDRFTLSERATQDVNRPKSTKLSMTEYRQSIGQDLAFVRETLRHKLAEYQLNPASRINVSRDEQGGVSLGGELPQETSRRIEQDLNNSKPFREAFSRLSASEPTLHFMDNALKLSQAYGVNNSLLDTIVSENQQFNGLQDLVHRYDTLRRSVASEESGSYASARDYAFSLNTQA